MKKKFLFYITIAAMLLTANCSSNGEFKPGFTAKRVLTIVGSSAVGGAVGAIATKNSDNRKTNATIGAVVGLAAGVALDYFSNREEGELKTTTRVNVPAQVLFSFNKYELTKSGKANLRALVNNFKRKISRDGKISHIVINGHTDNVGTAEYNNTLSHNRALAVANYLKTYLRKASIPVDPNKVIVKYFGETAPIASNDTAEGRARNRRVAIDITIMK